MRQTHYRDLILGAVNQHDSRTLNKIVGQLGDAERAREILRSKGYGATGMTASSTAAQVPSCSTRRT